MRRVYFITILVVITAFISCAAFARTSQESSNAHNKFSKWKIKSSAYQVKFKKRKIVRLKKSSPWPRQPFEFGGPVIENDRLFVGVRTNMFYSIGLKPLKKEWSFKTPGEVESLPSVHGDAVYFGDTEGKLYALKAQDGSQIWVSELDEPVSSQSAVTEDRIYVVTASDRLIAIDRQTGNKLWHSKSMDREFGFSQHTSATPLIVGQNIAMGTQTGAVVMFGPSGTILWQAQIGNQYTQIYDVDSMTTDGKRVFATSADGKIAAIDASNGKIIWDSPAESSAFVVLSGSTLYASGAKTLAAFDADTGTPKWEQEFEKFGLSPPAVGNGFIAVSSTKQAMFLVHPETGDILCKRYLRGGAFSYPLVRGNEINILSNTARLYSFEVKIREKKEGKGNTR